MAVLVFDDAGNRKFETGVDKGVLYILNTETGLYDTGFAWNGLTEVKEKPAGAAANPAYADNLKYMNLLSLETFSGEITAFTYPDAFGQCDGTAEPSSGLVIGQQSRAVFGMSYRTRLGNDLDADAGYKLHLVYGALASPSEKDYTTINDSPAGVSFTWAFDCSGITTTDYGTVSLITIDSTKVSSEDLATLEGTYLYGTSGTAPSLPTPDYLVTLFGTGITTIDFAELTVPTISSDIITIHAVTGVTWYVDGVEHATGALSAMTSGQSHVITAVANSGYAFVPPIVTSWLFAYS